MHKAQRTHAANATNTALRHRAPTNATNTTNATKATNAALGHIARSNATNHTLTLF